MAAFKIDVICALYNKEEYILKFLESFLLLNSSRFKLILIDDGSTDNGAKVVLDFIDRNNTTNIYLIQSENKGVSHARNLGIESSFGDYIWFCDPDDELLESANEVLKVIDFNESIDLFVFSYLINKIDECSNIRVDRYDHDVKPIMFLKNNSKFINNYDHPATDGTIWDKIYKSTVIKELRFDESLKCSEDFSFNLNVYKKINLIKTSQILIYQYNVYGKGTLSSTFTEKIVSDRISVDRNYLLYLTSKLKLDMNSPIKKSIVKSCNLLSKVRTKDGDILRFYRNEHSIFDVPIEPFINSREKCMYYMLKFKVFNLINTIRKKINLYLNRY